MCDSPFSLDPLAGGGSLMDLTRESDEASLGAELLDVIQPPEDELPATPVLRNTPLSLGLITKETNLDMRLRLKAAGFIHVTGLRSSCQGPDGRRTDVRVIGENTKITELGTHQVNHSREQIVTEGGEIWLANVVPEDSRDALLLKTKRQSLFKELCPSARGCYVHCSNGEMVSPHDLLYRLSDPDWMPKD